MSSVYDRILITGARGMLAQALARALSGRDVVRLPRAELDISDDAALAAAFRQHRPTLLLNCAAHTRVDLCEAEPERADAINGRAVGTMARLAREHGTAMVHYSTDFVFDGKSNRPYRIDDAPNPLSVYGRSKLLGERLLQENPPPRWLLIRTSWVYGPGGASFPQTMINAAQAGKPLRVVNDQTGTPTYTRDLADATLALLDANATGFFQVTNSGQTTWFGFTQATLEQFNLTADLQPITSADWRQIRPNSAMRPAYSVLDNSKYSSLTGKTMRSWREALRDYHAAMSQPQ